MTMTPSLVRVVWWDAEDAKDTWVSADEARAYADTPCEIVTYGFIVRKTRAYTVIAADYATATNGVVSLGRVTKVPTPWIRSITTISRRR